MGEVLQQFDGLWLASSADRELCAASQLCSHSLSAERPAWKLASCLLTCGHRRRAHTARAATPVPRMLPQRSPGWASRRAPLQRSGLHRLATGADGLHMQQRLVQASQQSPTFVFRAQCCGGQSTDCRRLAANKCLVAPAEMITASNRSEMPSSLRMRLSRVSKLDTTAVRMPEQHVR